MRDVFDPSLDEASIHSTAHGTWFLEKKWSSEDVMFINYFSSDSTQMSCYICKDGKVAEDVASRIGRSRRVPAVVVEKARASLRA